MESSAHILVVDDHREIRDLLARYLARCGLRVSVAESAAKARRALETSAIDLVVLDIMMPGEDGLSLCRHLRATTGVPVIMLTAMAEDTDRVIGLEIGADDYVVKPFNPRELLARIKAVLRRANSLPQQRSAPDAGTVRFERWQLNVGRRELIGEDGVGIPLSTSEFLLLSRAAQAPQDGAQPRSAARHHARPRRQRVRSQHRQPGEPSAQEDRGGSQGAEIDQDGVGWRLHVHRRCGARMRPALSFLRRLWPRRLAGQLIALLLLALILSQAASVVIFMDERRIAIRAAERKQILERTASVVRLIEGTPEALHGQIVRSASTGHLRFWLAGGGAALDEPCR